jgi:hypothetical protein
VLFDPRTCERSQTHAEPEQHKPQRWRGSLTLTNCLEHRHKSSTLPYLRPVLICIYSHDSSRLIIGPRRCLAALALGSAPRAIFIMDKVVPFANGPAIRRATFPLPQALHVLSVDDFGATRCRRGSCTTFERRNRTWSSASSTLSG